MSAPRLLVITPGHSSGGPTPGLSSGGPTPGLSSSGPTVGVSSRGPTAGLSPGGRPLAWWIAWLDALAAAGADAVLIREPTLAPDAALALVDAATARIAQVVVHARTPGGAAAALARGLTLHLPDGAATPSDRAFSASTHDGAGLDAALAAGARFALLSPVWTPQSKPDDPRPALGFDRFAALAVGRPVLALGGVDPRRFAALRRAGIAGAAVLGATRGEPSQAGAAVRALLSGG